MADVKRYILFEQVEDQWLETSSYEPEIIDIALKTFADNMSLSINQPGLGQAYKLVAEYDNGIRLTVVYGNAVPATAAVLGTQFVLQRSVSTNTDWEDVRMLMGPVPRVHKTFSEFIQSKQSDDTALYRVILRERVDCTTTRIIVSE